MYKYLCPWKGHLEVLKGAKENGCPWDEKASSNAARFQLMYFTLF